MGIIKIKNIIQRVFKHTWDMDYIQNSIYNDAAGAQKGINVQPVIKKAYAANEQVAFGSYVKLTNGGTYAQKCVGKAHDAGYDKYRRGDLVTNGGFIYVANQDIEHAHAFNADEWTKVADEIIAGIPCLAGDIVCVGKYHNAIDVAGFLCLDETSYRKVE